jgi:hypothetical protein
MKHLNILDDLLRYLSITKHNQFNSFVQDKDNKTILLNLIDKSILHSALLKLVKDGYVNTESDNSIDPLFKSPKKDHYYKISFEGMVFIENGGYENEYRKNQKEQIEYSDLQKRQSLLEDKQLKTQNQLVFLTFLVALGTLIAGLYYVLEILDFFGVLTSRKIQ